MNRVTIIVLIALLFSISWNADAQQKNKKLSYYGGFGLGISTDYFYVSLQPGLIYNVNKSFKLGSGLQYSYLKSNDNYSGVNYNYHVMGFNEMLLFYPVKQLELSGEFEDLYVMQSYNHIDEKYWSPALFGGLAYRYGNVVAGFKYNFLYKEGTSIYNNAFIPFIRIYF